MLFTRDEERRTSIMTRKAKLNILYWSASLGKKHVLIFLMLFTFDNLNELK